MGGRRLSSNRVGRMPALAPMHQAFKAKGTEALSVAYAELAVQIEAEALGKGGSDGHA